MALATLVEEGPRCPKCGMKMVKRYDRRTELYSSVMRNQQVWYWWCGCGHTEEGGIEPSEGECAREEWKAINGIKGDIMFPYYEELKKQLKEQYPHKQKREEI